MADQQQAQPSEDDGWEWAVVEIFGHRRHVGRSREVDRFGAKMVRIDVPVGGDPAKNGWESHFYGGSAIFSYTPTDEASAMRYNKAYAPPSPYRLPAPQNEPDMFDEHDDDDGTS